MQEPRQVICNLMNLRLLSFCPVVFLAALVAVSPALAQTKEQNDAKKAEDEAAKEALGTFSPPPVIPAIMQIEKPMMTELEGRDFVKEGGRKAFLAVLRNNPNSLNTAAQKAIDDAAKFHMYRMSLKSHRHELADLREGMRRTFQLKVKQGAVRNYFLERVTFYATKLLDGNFHVRLNAVFQLSELDKVPANRARKIPAVAYVGSLDPLLGVITDKDQPDAIKVAAAKGVMRILLQGDSDSIDEKIRYRVAEEFIPELKRKDAHFWYSMLLAKGLGISGIVYDRARKVQFVPDALLAVVVDKQRNWLTRCEAAKAIGRLPLDGKSDIKGIMGGLVNLGYEMSMAYNKAPKASYWKGCYYDLYFSFRAANSRVKPVPGLMNNTRILNGNTGNLVKSGYQVILPLVQHVLKNQPNPIDQKKIDDVADWLKSNQLMKNGKQKKTPGKAPSAEGDRKATVESASISD